VRIDVIRQLGARRGSIIGLGDIDRGIDQEFWTDIADPHSPMGAPAESRIGITGSGAAVMNALFTTPA
jgi:hypothetical protein